ncbi:hypothetical protein BGZ49_005294 [Haplosporangium sp. Z 27]|nr:hypothetical protein BGZ49_005294 [Haplosporangium sp. Z 27]
MATKPCGNCNKTVYMNEKINAEGKWYHRGCFKCMAPDCNIGLNLRNFQMAALDNSVIDPLTKRPLKVLVCKDHIPKPKTSLNSDSLAFRHTNSAPKPSIPGLHRSMMGERGPEVQGSDSPRSIGSQSPRSLDQSSHAEALRGFKGPQSPRSLDQGSHAEALRNLQKQKEERENESENMNEGSDDWDMEGVKKSEPEVISMQTRAVPMFRNGRVATVADPVAVSHVAAGEAQSPTKDDDSFRNIPVRPSDYDHQEGHFTQVKEEEEEESDEWDDPVDEDEDFTRPPVMKSGTDTAKIEESLEKKIEDVTLGSPKTFGYMRTETKDTVADNEKAVDEDEWDTTPADDLNRREAIAGM